MFTAAVLGGGSFGTAMAQVLAQRGAKTTLWLRSREIADSINNQRNNPRHLSNFQLHPAIVATTDLGAALAQPTWVFVCVPAQSLREVLGAAGAFLTTAPLVIAAKGIEVQTLMTMDEVAADTLGEAVRDRLLVVSGPSFANEIMQGSPTAVVLAGRSITLAEQISSAVFCDAFRAYTSTDVIGVEIGGALKNVIAIACGGVAALKLGANAQAALITRGLAEMTRLAVAKGANPLTLAGLSGIGDLVLTCTGAQSRNRQVGFALGEGKSAAEALAGLSEVAEGVETARSAYLLAKRLNVDMRITRAVYQVLHEGVSVREALFSILRHPAGSEFQ